jgi:peptidoglycan biosynthesis protein MviN/MurJ (putative lipid II flippase)
MSNGSNSFETIIKWVIVVILAIVALKVVATVLGIAWLVGGFLLTRVLPLVVMVWLGYVVVQWLRSDRGSSAGTL